MSTIIDTMNLKILCKSPIIIWEFIRFFTRLEVILSDIQAFERRNCRAFTAKYELSCPRQRDYRTWSLREILTASIDSQPDNISKNQM